MDIVDPQNISSSSLAFNATLFLMSVIAVFMVLRLPRLLALFGTSSEWLNGYILHHVQVRPSRRKLYTIRHGHFDSPFSESKENPSDSSHTLCHSASYRSHRNEKLRAARMRYPPHIPACPKVIRSILKLFRARIAPGFSIGQLVILSIYFYVLCFAGFYNSNIFLDQSRTGWIAVAQLPFVFAFAQKTNFLGTFFGFGYEKLNFLHRFAGKIVVIASNIHALHFLYRWSFDGVLVDKLKIKDGNPIWGFTALLCIDVFYLFSTRYVREKAYNLFLRSHIISMVVVLPAVYKHKPSTLPYVFACAAIYLFDRLLRLCKTRFTTAFLRPLPELDVTRVEIPTVNAGWRAGQHIRLRVLTLQMGWLAWAEVHPFTIASVSRSPEGLVLLCKRAGDWSRQLNDLATRGSKEDDAANRVRVAVEGPYGGSGHTIYSSFSAAVMIAGGSGITYALPIVQDLIQKDLIGESRTKSIDLIWSIPEPACLTPLLPALSALVQQSVYTPVRISIFYTRPPTGKQPVPSAVIQQVLANMLEGLNGTQTTQLLGRARQPRNAQETSLPPGITLSTARPNFPKVLDSAIQHAVSLRSGVKDEERITGMVVGVCGPVSMADDVSKAVSAVVPARRDQVGGIEICEEVFGW